jgi:signal transduction histidine kinase/CheY-like chemotaxis protein
MRRMGTGLELTARRKDNTNFPVEISLIPVQSREKSGVIAIVHDITTRRRTEEKLRQAQKLEALGRLAGGTAHEFNNLLAVIMGSAELILDSEEDKVKHVERIRTAAMRAGGLARQLLTFGRKQLLSVRILDLNQVLSEMSPSFADLSPGCHIECELLPPGQPLWIKADRLMMEQVITNLITNARDALPRDGKIQVSTRSVEVTASGESKNTDLPPGRYSLLSVRDNGIGMTPEVQESLFEPFFTAKGFAASPGMGLAMTYGMVTQGGGTISVQSKPGAGTTFNIYLPRPADHELHKAEIASPPVIPSAHGETILVVDDQPDLLLLTSEFLRQNGYYVLAAQRPSDALRIASTFNGPIHLLITDVIMPGMGGHEFARQFRISRPDAPVLYISGYTDEVFEGIELGRREAFIAKPFLTEELALKIRELLQRANNQPVATS